VDGVAAHLLERVMSMDRIAALAKSVWLVASQKTRVQAIPEIEQLLRHEIADATCEVAQDMRIRPEDE
jgi:hypothetical protein